MADLTSPVVDWKNLITFRNLCLLAVSLLSVSYWRRSKYTSQATKEPPVIASTIPYIGHLFGYIWYGKNYFETLGRKNSYPVFSVKMLRKKFHIVRSPELIIAVERNSKTLSFLPVVAAVLPRLLGIGPKAMEKIRENLDRKDGDHALMYDSVHAISSGLKSAQGLENMKRTALASFLPIINGIEEEQSKGDGSGIPLWFWTSRGGIVANTDALYGIGNPARKDRSIAQCFWEFESGCLGLLFSPAPSILARQAYTARTRIVNSLKQYFANGEYQQGSEVIQNQVRIAKQYGLSNDDLAHFNVGMLVGVLINTAPTMFWCLFRIYSDPQLLADLRLEIQFVMTTMTKEGAKTQRIDVDMLEEKCPLLLSSYREVLRVHTQAPTTRLVQEDTVLAGQYLLKKGSMVQIPGALIHADKGIWGSDAEDFVPRRFLNQGEAAATNGDGIEQSQHKVPARGAYRAWGGGVSMCPGRHFATTEIVSVLALMIMRFDIVPTENNGKWIMPERDSNKVTGSIHPPSQDTTVRVTTREAYDGHNWSFGFRDETIL